VGIAAMETRSLLLLVSKPLNMEVDDLKHLSLVRNALGFLCSLVRAVNIGAAMWLWLFLDTVLMVVGMDGLFV
jgi:hypothetical protein